MLNLMWMWPVNECHAQFEMVTINTGNNQFWGFSSRQVENHTFEVRTRRNDTGEWTDPHSYLDTDCNYDGGIVQVTDFVQPTDQINRLLIRPYTDEDRADYINGVNTLDIWVIQRYINALSSLDNWQLTAANVNVDNQVDSNDINLIRDLILTIRDDFGSSNRVSWGWVPHMDVLSFLSSGTPWVFALGYPSYWDVVYNNLSKNEITSSSANYFKFFTIKIGDVYAHPSNGSSKNDWVCGSGGYGSYFRDNQSIQTRSLLNSYLSNEEVSLEINDEVLVDLVLDYLPESVGALQIMLDIDPKYAEIKNIKFQNGLNPYYHYRKDLKQLAMVDYSKDATTPIPLKEGALATLTLKINRQTSELSKVIKWSHQQENLMIGMGTEYVDGVLDLRVQNIHRNSFRVDMINHDNTPVVFIESPFDMQALLSVFHISGQRISSRSITLNEGNNTISLPWLELPGIYILHVQSEHINQSIKFFNK